MEKFVPLSIPNFEGNEEKYVLDAVKQGWVSTGGAYITQLEEKVAEFLHVPMAVACQSGTAALHLALMECNVQPGDSVIVPTVTFIAAVNPVRYQFANPIFMDCDDGLCMDALKLEKFCEQECELKEDGLHWKKDDSRIKAMIVVHVFGNLANMEKIVEIAEKYKIKVIEDATEALGSKFVSGKYQGKYAGTIGDYGAYSFNGNKIITTGGGGALVARNTEHAKHAKYISTQAKDDVHYYIHNEVGFNYRMTNLQAALGVAQMEELPEFIMRKQRNYAQYQTLLKNSGMGYLMPFREGTESNQWFYAFVLNRNIVKAELREIITALEKRGVQTRAIWGLIHEQRPYVSCAAYEMEKAKYYSERVINLPCSTNLTSEDIEYVVNTLEDVLHSFAGV